MCVLKRHECVTYVIGTAVRVGGEAGVGKASKPAVAPDWKIMFSADVGSHSSRAAKHFVGPGLPILQAVGGVEQRADGNVDASLEIGIASHLPLSVRDFERSRVPGRCLIALAP